MTQSRQGFVGERPTSTPMALRPKDAARALAISERLLWEWTRNEGLPHVRIGSVVLYPVDCVKRWLDERANAAAHDGDCPS
jgi:excisionase family DNA binding protein